MLISKISAGSRCYLKCEEREDALEVCKEDQKKSELTKMSRFCPEDNVRCQMECFPKQEKLHRAKFVHGLPNAFKAHDISPEYLLKSSWKHFLAHGSEGSTFTSQVVAEGNTTRAEEMLHLPVAISKYRTIQDLDGKSKALNRFPWASGGFRSEDTRYFVNSINVHPQQEKELARASMPKVSFPRKILCYRD